MLTDCSAKIIIDKEFNPYFCESGAVFKTFEVKVA